MKITARSEHHKRSGRFVYEERYAAGNHKNPDA